MRAPFRLGDEQIPAASRATIDLPLMDISMHTPVNMSAHVVHGRRAVHRTNFP